MCEQDAQYHPFQPSESLFILSPQTTIGLCIGLLLYVKNCGLHMQQECRERFSPPPRVGDPDMHHGTCVTHVPRCMPGSLTSGYVWYRWWGKRSRHSRRKRNLHFYVSGKRPIGCVPDKWQRSINVYITKNYFAEYVTYIINATVFMDVILFFIA